MKMVDRWAQGGRTEWGCTLRDMRPKGKEMGSGVRSVVLGSDADLIREHLNTTNLSALYSLLLKAELRIRADPQVARMALRSRLEPRIIVRGGGGGLARGVEGVYIWEDGRRETPDEKSVQDRMNICSSLIPHKAPQSPTQARLDYSEQSHGRAQIVHLGEAEKMPARAEYGRDAGGKELGSQGDGERQGTSGYLKRVANSYLCPA
ncbi:hypothetical protein FIBSPDRAFT_904325 [Athelia psychrophila]|uniref:Uncharacterized protein n=1 Tax=Athelia psychrophila TaxID=1759441 RepID=A0A167UWR6_9AGAM|nr:hypothetical protein FIBSPDRAFT_904325 [Fibularhizoctonia sp. CBS 109695]